MFQSGKLFKYSIVMGGNGRLAGLIAQLEQKNEIINQLTAEIKNLIKELYGNEYTDENNK